jgi:hypothetical protein
LLVPSRWLRQQLQTVAGAQIAPVVLVATQARVSIHVACLRLAGVLPPGYVFAMADESGVVLLAGQTAGTGLRPPRRGEILRTAELDRFALDTEVINYRRRRIVWWRFTGDAPPFEEDDDDRSASDVLAGLFNRHVADLVERTNIQRTLSGVIGAANGEARREGETASDALYLRFRSRFARARALPEALLDDPDFDLWIRKRADELGDDG